MPTERTLPDPESLKAEAERPINHGFTTGGDITIRSSDGVDFSVHSIILSLASPAFSDLFPASARPEVVRLGETSEIVALMLGFIYPRPPPPISSFELLDKAMRVADKYQLEGMKTGLRKMLSEVDSEVSAYMNPLAALSVATTHGFHREADFAAQVASKRFNFHSEANLAKLLDAAPSATALIKLTGLPLVRTSAYVSVLFAFHISPMQLSEADCNKLVCGYCRPMYLKVTRYSPPEWQARWAYWVFTEIKNRPIEECAEFFNFHFTHITWYKSGGASVPNNHGSGCCCYQGLTLNSSYFNQWASGVYEHLKKRVSSLEKYKLSQTL